MGQILRHGFVPIFFHPRIVRNRASSIDKVKDMKRFKDKAVQRDPLATHYNDIGPAALRAALLFAPRKKETGGAGRKRG